MNVKEGWAMSIASLGSAISRASRGVLMLGALSMPILAQTPAALTPPVPHVVAHAALTSAASPRPPVPGAALTAADVNGWLDGLMPYALATGDIAGAVIVVVKDGKIVTQRGFGYADVKKQQPVDPAATLFRPGSTSKLLTWTAVMQQVQAGRLDLDRDVNDYLDFKIPPAFGEPITLRNLMTHTAGFEESAKYLLTDDPAQLKSLGATLKRGIPARIYAPGSMASYSNYGASLAGYIVQRVSGEPFEAYIQRHIFAPLGMAHSSFIQPLPAALAPQMSKGYNVASQDPKPFEIIGLSPAGALSSTGADMARFMIAHLSDGGPLLDPSTTRLMHTTANTPIPGLPGMALGFYHEDRNGHEIVGHAGDTDLFHSDLHLFLDDHVGLFLSFNSAGKDGAAHILRDHLFDAFTDRYFPEARSVLPTSATARAHGEAMAGHYVSSRGSIGNFLRFVGLLGETNVTLEDDSSITVSTLTNPAGVPKRWREVGPWQWREIGGRDRLNAVARDGHVELFSIAAFAPIIEFLPAPANMNAGWILPTMAIALGIIAWTALAWPVVALVRRRYGYHHFARGRELMLWRATRITAWLLLVIAGGWTAIIMVISNDISMADDRLDIWMRLLQLLSLAAIVGTAAAIGNAYVVARQAPRRWFATLWAILVALSSAYLVWLTISAKLLTLTLNY
jgi:CubicO group peptidase (beta-lactamase class C family)